MKLNYKTRGMLHPQGKPKVYFSCHPDDFDKYFSFLSGQILQEQDCAIWYNEKPQIPCTEDELEVNLSQMQLFVIPITTNYLLHTTTILEQEYKLAQREHIPMLMLMMESGLEEIYNAKCGNIQYLNPYDSDTTAIRYSEKLKKFLESVLIGDELAEKIKAAFDAYIFLSYRKKDRKYARQLMELIHKNEFCRDIAIWYDEYLVPGENFNDSILEAMRKSQLFTLAVTPNLVNEENYIMTTEYPTAKKAEKEMLAIEMVATDKDKLNELYDKIPACIPAHEEAEVSQALLEKIQKLAIRENDNSPEHNFFIGLAYLGGVDVEVNQEKAFELIKGSADAGLEEAIEKLAHMYKYGDGVARDYEKAVIWQKKLLEIKKKRYQENPSVENGVPFLKEADNLFEYLYDLGEIEECKLLTQMLLHELSCHEKKGKEYHVMIAPLYNQLGAMAIQQGDLSSAAQYCEKALQLYGKERKGSRIFVSICYNMGDINIQEGNLDKAERYYQKAMMAVQNDDEVFEETEKLYDMAALYEKLWDVAREKGDSRAESEYAKKQLDICTRLAETNKIWKYHVGMIACYGRLGDMAQGEGALSEAKRYFQKALELGNVWLKKMATISCYDAVAYCYISLAEINRREGKLEEAGHCIYEAQKLCKKLEKSERVEHTMRLVAAYYIRGDLECQRWHLQEAERCMQKGSKICETAYQKTKSVKILGKLSVGYGKLGRVYHWKGELEKAKEYFQKSLQIEKKLTYEKAGINHKSQYIFLYAQLGEIAKTEGNWEMAKENYDKAITEAKSVFPKTNQIADSHEIAKVYLGMGDMEREMGNQKAAKVCYHESQKMLNELVETSEMTAYKNDLGCVYERMGYLSEEERKPDEAKNYYEKAISVWLNLANQTNKAEDYRNLALSYCRMLDVSLAKEELVLARDYGIKAFQIFHKLAQETKTPESMADLAIAYRLLGDLCETEGNKKAAKKYYAKEKEIHTMLNRK